MLKKITGIIALFCLAAGAAVYLSSCAQIAGPLSPDIKLNAASSTAGSELLQVMGSPTMPASLTQTARIRFNLPLDPATVNSSTVQAFLMEPSAGTTESPASISISYNAAARELTIAPATGSWTNSSSYRFELTTGLHSIAGAQLDGNANGIAEAPQFDNYHTELIVAFGAPLPTYSYTSKATAVQVEPVFTTWETNANSGGSTFSFGQNYGYISATYSHVTITVHFTTTAGPMPMDSSTFYNGPNTLHPNVVFTDANNLPVTPLSVSVVTTTVADDTLVIVFNNLQPSSKYLFKLKGGLNGIRSSNASSILGRNFYFDGGNILPVASIAEQNDDTEPAVFMTQPINPPLPRVFVSSAVWDNPNRRFDVTFTVPTGISTLDPASITNNNFLLWNNNSQIPIIPTSIVLDNSPLPINLAKVYVYLPLVLSPYGAGTYEVFLTVRKEVRSADGISLDQNNDGVLMTDDDNFQSGSNSIDGY